MGNARTYQTKMRFSNMGPLTETQHSLTSCLLFHDELLFLITETLAKATTTTCYSAVNPNDELATIFLLIDSAFTAALFQEKRKLCTC